MSLTLPAAPARYELADQSRLRDALRREDRNCLKRGQDIELVGARLILTAPGGGQFALKVDDSGNLSTAPLA